MRATIFFLLFLTGSAWKVLAQNDYSDETTYLKSHKQNPAQYVIEKCSRYDLVFLGEDHCIKENLEFAASLIPELYRIGVYNLGMEFGASEMQKRLDSLVTGKEYDAAVAREMMYYYNVGWAYQEYTDIYYAAWKFNQTLKPSAKKFRIINISYHYDWSHFEGQRTPENMAEVFMKGTPDDYRANLIEETVLKKGEKIVVLTGTPHAFTHYEMPMLLFNSDGFCSYDDGWLGNRLYRKYPDRTFTIILHQPFYSKPNKKPWGLSPANGAIEKIMTSLDNKSCGFDLINSPVGKLTDSSFYSTCYPNFTMDQLFDGYIFLKPFNQLHGCTVDTLYFKSRTWQETSKQLPDIDWHGRAASQDEFWEQIKSYTNIKSRYKDVLE